MPWVRFRAGQGSCLPASVEKAAQRPPVKVPFWARPEGPRPPLATHPPSAGPGKGLIAKGASLFARVEPLRWFFGDSRS